MAAAAASSSGAGSSSSSAGGDGGDAAGWIYPLTSCPHLLRLSSPALPPLDSPCSRCSDLSENWACLSCQDTLCGRYINQHMLEHAQALDHPVAMSFRDLSAWCFKCDAYLDAQLMPELRPAFESLYRMKFGEEAPARTSHTITTIPIQG